MDLHAAFSTRYAAARDKFLEAAAAANMTLRAYEHPLKGRDGETLALDVALDGSPDAERLFVVSSGCHGVEGYCGSGVQICAAHDAEWRVKARASGVAVLYIHALNPYGFSHLRRTTHENVDLNRNFQDFSQPLPVNEAYGELQHLLLPEQWPPNAENQAASQAILKPTAWRAFRLPCRRGSTSLPTACSSAALRRPGATAPCARCSRPTVSGHAASPGLTCTPAWAPVLSASGFLPARMTHRHWRARAWWSGGGATPVTSFYDGSSTSARLTRLMWSAVDDECPQAQYTGIAMEYGTLPILDIIAALRAEHWLHNHPEAPPEQQAAIRRQMMDAFYVDTDPWRAQIVAQARQAMFQAVDGLNAG